ncbi:MAG: response regulator transcription factor [Chloroflexota bacterium]
MLVIDDARDVAEVVAFGARMNWPDCQVTICTDGADGIRRFEADPADLVVLDISMPPPDGFEVCRHLRQTSQVPILMLTVRSATLDKIRALDLGADDYLTKPFDHLELLARLRALWRRAKGPPLGHDDVTLGDLSIDYGLRSVRLRGVEVKLTSTEYRMLEVLVRHVGMIVPHQSLLTQVWGPGYVHDTHYVKVFVRRLRQKLGDSSEHPRYIHTEWGVGYRFVPPREPPAPR